MTVQTGRSFPFVTQSVIFQFPLEQCYVQPDSSPGCDVRWYRDSDASVMGEHGYPQAYLDDRLSKGARIIVAESEGRTVGWKFYQTGEVDQLSWLTLHVPSDMIFALAAFVIPEMRGKRIADAISAFGIRHFKKEGYRRRGTNCETWNTVAISGSKRLGGSEVMTVTRRNYLLFHTANLNGQTHVGYWGPFTRFPVDIP